MSKRTIILISFLIVLTVFFVYLAISQKQRGSMTQSAKPMVASPTAKPIPAYTTLMLSPENEKLASSTGSIDVLMDTASGAGSNRVTAVQLELQYDPKVLTNVSITPEGLFAGSAPLFKTTNTKSGRITYALGVSPTQKGIEGKGKIATIRFTSTLAKGATTPLTLLPSSLVTAEGETVSVLKKGTGATITAQ